MRLTIKNRITVAFITLALVFTAFPSIGVIDRVYAESTIATTDSSLNVNVDSTVTVYLTGESSDAISWNSSNTNAAVIESSTSRKAVVKGVGKGSSNIVATDDNGNTATCVVNIQTPKFTITNQLLMAVEEEDTIYVNDGAAVTWSSSNNDIVSILSRDSRNARIKAESVGTAVITAVDKYGSESKCTIKIRQERFEVTLYAWQDSEGYNYSTADFTGRWLQQHQEGWWDNDYNYYDSYDYYDALDYYVVDAIYGTISKCTSGNTNVATVTKSGGEYRIYPKGVGSTTITAEDPYGEKETFNCKVTLNYFVEKESTYADGDDIRTSKNYTYKNAKYGDSKITGVTYNGAKVVATINGKSYSAKASGSGYYSVNIPKYIKINTPITIKTTQYGVTKTYKRTITNNKPGLSLSSIKKSSKIATITLKNVHKGDSVKIKIGKKTYTKKIKKDSKKIVLKIKTKKQKKGQKVTATVYNKHKQKLTQKNKKIK